VIWHVTDEGRIEVRLKAQGEQAIKVARVRATSLFESIVEDLATNQHVTLTSNELRYSFSKTRPEVTIIWRSEVEADAAPKVRDYLVRLGESISGEVTGGTGWYDAPDQ
jgi:outer membrane cobalamin receptor